MKSRKLFLGMALTSMLLMVLGLGSCEDKKATEAKSKIETYVIYVDSIEKVTPEDIKVNWDAIDAAYQLRSSEAELALADLKDDMEAQEKINASRAKYEALKAKMDAEFAVNTVVNKKQQIRNALFGEGKVGEDMNFDWVNAANILEVYRTFIHTAEDNKDSYTREDWDEIKLMYEALDSRKNTVEKEGLSSDDNSKIASLKVKFGPMITVNRIGAKSEETAEAKK
jgi:hypothetical protein